MHRGTHDSTRVLGAYLGVWRLKRVWVLVMLLSVVIGGKTFAEDASDKYDKMFTDAQKRVLKWDQWTEEQKKIVYDESFDSWMAGRTADIVLTTGKRIRVIIQSFIGGAFTVMDPFSYATDFIYPSQILSVWW